LRENIQVHNIPHRKTQLHSAQAGLYAQILLEGRSEPSTVFCLASGGKLTLTEVNVDTDAYCKAVDIPLVEPSNLCTAMEYSQRYGFLFVVTAKGTLYVYEVSTATLVLMTRVSEGLIFATVPEQTDAGFIGVGTDGQVLAVTVDPAAIVEYIATKRNNPALAELVAQRAGLSGHG
jgi:hypothetical protein